ncbi:apolipoprotein D-like [Plectropomus leopardus]|uniref:apolipoprotein D-like n=2 Tax=Plectropomus leopardus TaxID=160734 RepID=UPI001C4BA325|nr:apolipoprotein D-like [Plectropomus leopardus]
MPGWQKGCGEKMNAIQVISLTLLSALAVNAQVISPGRCPKPAVQANFDAARYLGKWYDIQRLPHTFQKGECCTATYSLKSPGVVGVLNKELLADGTISSISGSAWSKDPAEPAKLQVSFFENSPPAPYWVLSTDYDNYSLVYSCTDLGVLHVEFAWIMSRQPTLPEETLEELHSTLSSIGVRVDKLLTTNQDVEYCSAMNQ